ncbi:putative phage abortive infection protein [Aliarcobacter butzleri]|uniref:Phage abortive infection protein n=1 Tax=Aliarcobacter butzleri L352 TaxID=1447260 RepID=A0A837JDL6_9BACT|nr:putative phage abortive infection protein [Aliarcobacter butzleri]KLE05546.1 hypothetical protein AF77_04495 [Aliarcobacter butzleri L352]
MKKNKSFKEKINNFLKEWWGIGLIAFIAMLTIFIFGYFYFSKHSLSWLSGEVEELGQMGDFFGGTLNPILAFLSFCLLLITIKLQSKELKNSTDELAKSSLALTEQSKSLKIQNFENTFFNMIGLHGNISHKLDGSIKFKCDEFKYTIKSSINIEESITFTFENSLLSMCKAIRTLKDKEYTLNHVIKDIDPIIGHYFRSIYQILEFIDLNDSVANKKFYSNILRAQLSQYELGLLFYYCVSRNGIKLMLNLITKYEFLEYLEYKKEFENIYLEMYIEESRKFDENNIHKAFGDNDAFRKVCENIVLQKIMKKKSYAF